MRMLLNPIQIKQAGWGASKKISYNSRSMDQYGPTFVSFLPSGQSEDTQSQPLFTSPPPRSL